MKIFLSWSGRLSYEVSKLFTKRLTFISSEFEIFSSDSITSSATSWGSQISEALENSDVILMFITGKNSPWMLFEAGVARSLNITLIPITVGIRVAELEEPISQFQAVDGTSKKSLSKLIELLLDKTNISDSEYQASKGAWEKLTNNLISELNVLINKDRNEQDTRNKDKKRATDAFDKAWREND